MDLKKIKELLNNNLTYKQSLIFYFSILIVFLFPIINNDLPYRDDQVRIIRGNDWAFMGRNMADLVMHILTFSYNKLSNISPLTFLLSILVISFTFSKFIQKSSIEKTIINHISLSFIFISPFYLQNFSYQYDNLTMSLGVCFSMYSFIIEWNRIQTVILSILLLTCSIFFFQPVSNIFVIIVLFNILLGIKNKENILKDTFKGAGIYFISVILYYLLFNHYFELSSSNRATLVPVSDILNTFNNALIILGKFLTPFIYSPSIVFLFISILIFFIFFFFSFFKSKENFLLKTLTIISPIFIFIFIWGPFIMLEETFARPREFVSIGVIISFILLYNNQKAKSLNNINIIVILSLMLYCFSLCYQYSNLSKEEYSFDKMLTEWISKDINSDKNLYNKKLVYLNSHPDYSPGSQIILSNQPFLQYIQMPYYNWFSRFYLENRGVKNIYKDLTNIDDQYDWNAICKTKTAKLVIENKYYNIYIINNPKLRKEIQEHVSVWFKRSDDVCEDRPNIIFKRNLFFIEDAKINN